MAGKTPTAEEILTDPKYTEQKGFLKKLITGIAKEIQDENPSKDDDDDDEPNFWDVLMGGGKKK